MRATKLCVLVAAMALAGSSAQAGFLSGPTTFTGDGDIGISSSKAYTHLIDPGSGSAAVINGVEFNKVTTATSTDEADYSSTLGFKYTKTPYNTSIGYGPIGFASGGATGTTSGSGANTLLSDFLYGSGYNNSATIQLSKLTAGNTYEARLYYRTWDASDPKNIALTFDEGSGTAQSTTINENGTGGAAQYISYAYTAASSSLTITLAQADIGNSWHLYGLTNQLVAVQTPEPSTLSLFATGVLGMLAYAWRKRN